MYKFIASAARPRVLLIAVASFLAMFAVMQVLASRVTGLPDMLFSYTPGRLIAILDSYGTAGRLAYMRIHIADMFFPLAYGALYVLVLIYFWGVRGGAPKTASLLAVISIAGVLMDISENVCIRIVSALFSQGRTAADIAASLPFAATLAGIATPVKWGCDVFSMLAMLAGIVFAIVRRKRLRGNGGGRRREKDPRSASGALTK